MDKKLQKQLEFLMEIDKMKTILRQNLIADSSKRENDAEHSWHMAMLAITLSEYAAVPIDLLRVVKMCLLHDLVEVYAGDTFCYDIAANAEKAQREQAAADKLFGLLPETQGAEYRALWEEFDRMDTADSVFAGAVDRIQPFLLNYCTNGHTWELAPVNSQMVYQRMLPVKKALPALWTVMTQMIEDCIERGILPRA